MDAEEFLAHYGVKGMKWGVRRTVTQLAGGAKAAAKKASDAAKGNPSDDSSRRHELGRKKVSELSTKELKELTERMQLEKKLVELNTQPKSETRKFMEQEGKKLAAQAVQKYAVPIIGNAVANRPLLDGIIGGAKGKASGQAPPRPSTPSNSGNPFKSISSPAAGTVARPFQKSAYPSTGNAGSKGGPSLQKGGLMLPTANTRPKIGGFDNRKNKK